jgi:hypothetical protein
MPDREPRAHGANDVMLVLGVAAVVLGMVMVSQGVRPAQPAAHRVPSAHAALMPTERALPVLDERLAADTFPRDRVPPMPRTTGSGAATAAAACTPRLDLDHDLRLVLLAMALQRRRTLHPTAHYVPPDKQDVPAKDRALAGVEESVARAEASPPAVGLPRGPGCCTRWNKPGDRYRALVSARLRLPVCVSHRSRVGLSSAPLFSTVAHGPEDHDRGTKMAASASRRH